MDIVYLHVYKLCCLFIYHFAKIYFNINSSSRLPASSHDNQSSIKSNISCIAIIVVWRWLTCFCWVTCVMCSGWSKWWSWGIRWGRRQVSHETVARRKQSVCTSWNNRYDPLQIKLFNQTHTHTIVPWLYFRHLHVFLNRSGESVSQLSRLHWALPGSPVQATLHAAGTAAHTRGSSPVSAQHTW